MSDDESERKKTAAARLAKTILDAKRKKTQAKRSLSRKLTRAYELLTDGEMVNTTDLKQTHDDFLSASDAYIVLLEGLEGDDDEAVERADEEAAETESKYRDLLAQVRKAGEAAVQISQVSDRMHSTSVADSERDNALATLNLPHVKLDTFSGDPKQYHSFIKSFDCNVDLVVTNPDMKLARLNQYCVNEAKRAIRSAVLIGGEAGYLKAKEILKERFGSKDLVTQTYIHDLTEGTTVKSNTDYRTLADELSDAQMVLTELGTIARVDSQEVIQKIARRLPENPYQKFRRSLLSAKRADKLKEYPGFAFLVTFVCNLADDNNEPTWGYCKPNERVTADTREKKEKKKSSNVSNVVKSDVSKQNVQIHVSKPSFQMSRSNDQNVSKSNEQSAQPSNNVTCVLCKTEPHKLWHCKLFKSLPVTTRLQFVIDSNLCINCFSPDHKVSGCPRNTVCFVKGCDEKHSMYVHVSSNSQAAAASTTDQVESDPESAMCTSSKDRGSSSDSFMPVVKVKISIPRGETGKEDSEFFALLDPASSKTYADAELRDSIGGPFETSEETQRTLFGERTTIIESIPYMSMSSVDGEFELDLEDVHVHQGKIPVKNSVLNRQKYSYLANLPELPAYNSNVKISLLIGQDHADAFIPLETRRAPEPNLPYAVRTPLGWTVWGGNKRRHKNVVHAIESNVNKLWNIENDGLESSPYSQDDVAVTQLWDRETKVINGRYQIPPPWKDTSLIPNNMLIAKRCLSSLTKRLKKKQLYEKYDSEMKLLLENEYAEVVPTDEINRNDGRVNYLSHHDVIKPSKPDKLRPVFNAAGKFKGKSMNDRWYQGPDLLNKLISVLNRFRQHEIAIQGDIKAMYHQVALPPSDYDYFRFLWEDANGNLIHLRFTRHLFGAVFCSASSTYALRRTVNEFPDVPEVVKRVVEEDMYVDDMLTSQPTTNGKKDAITVITKTPEILERRKFPLTQMITNDPELLKLIPEDRRSKNVVELTPESVGRTLGLKWNILKDEFFFLFDYTPTESLTRRQLLSTLSTIYDPLGFLGCYILAGKLIFQEATRQKIEWDDVVPPDLYTKWCEFADALSQICGLKVPRCVKPTLMDDAVITLHNFSDASLTAYGCMCYIHCRNANGEVQVNLLMTKHKVAPLKSTTIPRLELQAATISAKLNSYLRSELTLNICQSYFYTDSEIVLAYIANDSRRFHVFVSNRVSVIRQLTEVPQWNHIPGSINPADLITRINPKDSVDIKTWLHGPEMLQNFVYDPDAKPDTEPPPLSADDAEVRKTPLCCNATVSTEPWGLTKIMKYYSSWRDMKRAAAWFIRLSNLLRAKIKAKNNEKTKPNNEKTKKKAENPLSKSEISQASTSLILFAQKQSFTEEILYLKKHESVFKSSRLVTLRPYLDNDDVLRVGGRLKNAASVKKNPIILAADHDISAKIVRDAHCKSHVGPEWTMSELSDQNIFILKGRPLIKRIVKSCVTCRRLFAKTCTQLMADLPSCRVAVGGRPFQCAGCDVFGPFLVKVNRSQVKRYGLIITCMSSRAVGIEMLYSLNTSSCINSLRRFIARRSQPDVIMSDQGTNFIGADRELKSAVKEFNSQKLQNFIADKNIQWEFIPPNASHWAGAWERLVGVVKKVFKGILPVGTKLTDEILLTLLSEAEYIVNTRPLTKVSDNPDDPTPLRPIDLLIYNPPSSSPMGLFTSDDQYRSVWKHTQHLTDQFWKKFVKLYLPSLQKRVKWTDVQKNVAAGDLVLMSSPDPMTPRYRWPLGLVKSVNTGPDGYVRDVNLKLVDGTNKSRPITKLVLLESKSEIINV